MHSVLLFLDPFIPPRFHYIDRHQCLFNLLHWSSYRPNQSRNIRCGTHTRLLQGFWILKAVLQFHIWLIVCLPVVFSVVWIIQVPIPVKPIFSVWNAFRWAIPITFSRIAVNSFDSADIQYLRSSPREVLCRQSWRRRWFFRQFTCSRTVMLKVSPGCFDDLLSIWNVSYGRHLLILSVRFLLCSAEVLATLPYLQNVVDHGHSMQLLFLYLSLHLHVVISAVWFQYRVIASQYSDIGLCEQPYYNNFAKSPVCGFRLPPPDQISPKGRTGLHYDTVWDDREYVTTHIGEIDVVWVRFFLLSPSVSDFR